MTVDAFQDATNSLVAPARTAFAITPDDATDMPAATRAVYVGQGGNLVVCLVGDEQDAVFLNVAPGTLLPIRIKAVRATGTSASQILGLA